jgi:hypothetical protein
MGGKGFRNPPPEYGTGAVTVNGASDSSTATAAAPLASGAPSDGSVCCRTMRTSSTATRPGVYLCRCVSGRVSARRRANSGLDIAYSGRVSGFLNWWDGVELWLSGLPFIAQTAVVMPVVLALAYGIAILLDGALGNGIRILRRVRHQDEDEE